MTTGTGQQTMRCIHKKQSLVRRRLEKRQDLRSVKTVWIMILISGRRLPKGGYEIAKGGAHDDLVRHMATVCMSAVLTLKEYSDGERAHRGAYPKRRDGRNERRIDNEWSEEVKGKTHPQNRTGDLRSSMYPAYQPFCRLSAKRRASAEKEC